MLDYYDLVLQYGNDDAIATDKWTGRNAFFLEEAAMIDDEVLGKSQYHGCES